MDFAEFEDFFLEFHKFLHRDMYEIPEKKN